MLNLDHIAIGCTYLAEGTAWVENALGVPMVAGGKHARFGTHNTLLGLADGLYLEVITKDPQAPDIGRPTWFGLDDFTGPPRLANWICAADTLDDAPDFAGEVTNLTRDDLSWQITVPQDGSLPFDGGFPTMISWGTGVTHPSAKLPSSGVRLVTWEVVHPQADHLRATVPINDPRVSFATGETIGFIATFKTPTGTKVLT